MGRTRAVEILRGGRSKVIASTPTTACRATARSRDLRSDDVLGRVDELLAGAARSRSDRAAGSRSST